MQVQLNDNSKTIINPSTDSVILLLERHTKTHEEILLLERHTKTHEESIQNISKKMQNKTRQVECFDNKLSYACHQNGSHLSLCGNCHLKIGHTRKSCT
jgi:hypothetical protein